MELGFLRGFGAQLLLPVVNVLNTVLFFNVLITVFLLGKKKKNVGCSDLVKLFLKLVERSMLRMPLKAVL